MGVAWNGNNIGGSTKRAVGIAMHVGKSFLVSKISVRLTEVPFIFQVSATSEASLLVLPTDRARLLGSLQVMGSSSAL